MKYKKERMLLCLKIKQMLDLHLLTVEGGGFSLKLNDGNILATPTGASFRLWEVNPEDFLVSDSKGKIVEKGKYFAVADFPLDLHIFSNFPQANAVVHLHAPYSLAFASALKDIPPSTNLISKLLPVPCLHSPDEDFLKKSYQKNPYTINMPEAVVQKPEVFIVFDRLIKEFDKTMLSRKNELKDHGLAFIVEKHGLFVFAKNIDEAIENSVRIEAAARTEIFKRFL